MGTIYGKLFPKEEIKIIFQGLDAAGKTTALYRLKLGEVVTTIPTIGFNVETVDYKNINITVWDVGGRDKIRPLYRYYYPNTKALVFVVDSSDREEYRIEQARDELHRTMAEDELGDIPLLVLANKQDLANAMSVVQITEELQLHKLGARNWYIIPTVATTGDGLYDALDWLTDACKCKTKKDTEHSKAAEPNDKDSKSKETENSNELTKPTTTSYMNKAFDTLKRIFFAQG